MYKVRSVEKWDDECPGIWSHTSTFEDYDLAKTAFEQAKSDPQVVKVELSLLESGLLIDSWNRDETNIVEKLRESQSSPKS